MVVPLCPRLHRKALLHSSGRVTGKEYDMQARSPDGQLQTGFVWVWGGVKPQQQSDLSRGAGRCC